MSPESVFRLLSDPTRLRCVVMLRLEPSLCVCELTHALDLSQPKTSRHLAMLRAGGLVVDERRGQWVHYRLAGDLPGWVRAIVDAAVEAQRQSGRIGQDSLRLETMVGRPSPNLCA
jgi:ArsR family transcriptional regulator, arsenate/arsenite/antimonite-responsive transcriptional repressor